MSCTRCGCTTSCTCSSSPYYSQADVCTEDHCEKICVTEFTAAVCPTTSWNVPLCGQTAMLAVDGLAGASVGSYLWHKAYGYFEITSVDVGRGLLGVTNNCTEGNASPGVQIPACTCFVVTVPPAASGDAASGVCVEIDFTAPEQDVQLDITLSSTQGLAVADTVQIGTGFYFIYAIKPNNIITIINQGEGIVPGTPVIAKDANGNYQYCLSIISTNPCGRDPISEGTLLACDEDGVTAPLGTPCQAGYIPVATGDCTVEMQPAISPPLCMHLTDPVAIVNGDATYTLVLDDTTGILEGDILTISGMGTTRATVTAVTDSTHLNVTLVPTPGAAATLPIGTLVCTVDCCEEIQNRLALQLTDTVTSSAVTPATLTSAPSSALGNIANAGPFVNTSTTDLSYIATVEFVWAGYYEAGDQIGDYVYLIATFLPYYAVVTGAIGTTVAPTPVVDVTTPLADSFGNDLGDEALWFSWNYGQSYSYQIAGVINPGDELRVAARAGIGLLELDTNSLVAGLTYNVLRAKITSITITSA